MATQWWRIKAAYLEKGMTYRELAQHYKLSERTIRNRASKEGWGKEKDKIESEARQAIHARAVKGRVEQLEKLIEANELLLDGLVDLAKQVKDDPKLLIDKTGSLRNAESFAKALQTATMTQRDVYGLKNIDQKFAAKKWKEQQKLEREKAAGPQFDDVVWEIKAPEGVELDG